jgi:hypothetical protein
MCAFLRILTAIHDGRWYHCNAWMIHYSFAKCIHHIIVRHRRLVWYNPLSREASLCWRWLIEVQYVSVRLSYGTVPSVRSTVGVLDSINIVDRTLFLFLSIELHLIDRFIEPFCG